MMSALEKKLDALIAREDHIRPEDVNLEHIRQCRDKNDSVTYDFSTKYGGFDRRSAKVLTPAQSTNMIASAYRFLAKFGRHSQ